MPVPRGHRTLRPPDPRPFLPPVYPVRSRPGPNTPNAGQPVSIQRAYPQTGFSPRATAKNNSTQQPTNVPSRPPNRTSTGRPNPPTPQLPNKATTTQPTQIKTLTPPIPSVPPEPTPPGPPAKSPKFRRPWDILGHCDQAGKRAATPKLPNRARGDGTLFEVEPFSKRVVSARST